MVGRWIDGGYVGLQSKHMGNGRHRLQQVDQAKSYPIPVFALVANMHLPVGFANRFRAIGAAIARTVVAHSATFMVLKTC